MSRTRPPLESTQSDRGNLLSEPLIGIADARGERTPLTLPGLLARMADPKSCTVAFTGLQAHQSHAWHAFLVQLAAMVCHRAGIAEPSTDAVWWADRLRELAGGESAWTLVVSDLAQPAFMQPPVPEGSLDGFANHLATPGALDLLVTAKNHDRKLEAGSGDSGESWLFALVSLQTGQGYSGKANYGIFRMNGGLGNRPGIGIRAGLDLGAMFRRDVQVVLAARSTVLERGMFRDDGLALLWLKPWDGQRSVTCAELDPWVIECCRRVRLSVVGNGFVAVMASTKVARVEVSDDHAGNVGDPWTPIGRAVKNLGKSLTLPGMGFTYQRVAELLLSADWEVPPSQTIRPGDTGDLHWYGRALVRGQGKTEGWHDREVLIPATLRSRFATKSERDRLADTAKRMVECAGVMRLNILKPSLLVLWEDAEGRIADGLMRLEQGVDAAFFPHLWDHPDSSDAWRECLAGMAAGILEQDIPTLGPSADRWKRISAAQSRFHFLLRTKNHPVAGIFLPAPVPKVVIP